MIDKERFVYIKMGRSFIVTGASAAGKTTLVEYAKKQGYILLPNHTTRNLKENEINGKDIVSISNKEFIDNFNKNLYFEPSLDSAMHKGLSVYYGTPKKWKDNLEGEKSCAIVSSPLTARLVKKEINVIWVHLYCSDEERYKRLKERGIGEEEIEARMHLGDSIQIPKDVDLLIDTGKYRPNEILEIINK